MSRCSSPKGALTLVLACPQPRGSKFHRVVFLKHAFYGWSQVGRPQKLAQLQMSSIENSCLRSTELWNMLNHHFSQKHESDVCQYVTDDCTIRYEFVHKQIMRPTTPQNSEEWKSLGPQYFCNSWPGNGRSEWVSERVSI